MARQPDIRAVERLLRAGRVDEAASALRALTRAAPRDAELRTKYGAVLRVLGRFDEAERELGKAIELRDTPGARVEMAMCLRSQLYYERAAEHAGAAAALDPDSERIGAIHADLLRRLGRVDEARRALDAWLDDPRAIDTVLAYAACAPELGESEVAATRLGAWATGARFSGRDLGAIHMRRARLLDELGRYDDAFAAADAGNRLLHPQFDAEAFARRVGALIEHWTADRAASVIRARETSSLPVFIVGVPRSGSTLVEQIIDSHPRGAGGGELMLVPGIVRDVGDISVARFDRSRVERLSRRLFQGLKRVAPDAERVTDKMLSNLVHLPLLSMIAPGAKIVRCRRDPMDACLSCYLHHFEGLNPFAYSLTDLGVYARQADRLLDHFESVLDLETIAVQYEELVSDVDTQSRRLIGFLGLEWDDACLRFHENPRITGTASESQVRAPAHTRAIGRHRNYERHLGPLREALGL